MTTTGRQWMDDVTRADALVAPAFERPTKTTQDELAEEVGRLRGATRFLLEDVAGIHDEAIEIQLEARTDEAAKRSVPDLLSELANLGFAWRAIAQLVDVTVPAVRKWRQGEPATGPHRRAVARLLAFVHLLQSDHLVNDTSSWMEIPLAGSPISAIDVYSGGGEKALLLFASGHLTSEELLDGSDATWRDAIDNRFEVVRGDDGEPIIRLRSEPGA
jgi:hypothetical protein